MAVEFESKSEDYIGVIREQRLNHFPDAYRDEMVRVFGADRVNLGIISEGNFRRARRYLESPAKQVVEQLLGGLAWFPGMGLTRVLANWIEKIDGPDGLYKLRVGFGEEPAVEEFKLRTYKNGEDRKNHHFQGANYQTNGKNNNFGEVIEHRLPKVLRRTGFDELPQLRAVAMARMSFVGLRGYTRMELGDQEIMFRLIDSPEVGYTDEVREIIKNHHYWIRRQYLKPAIVHPRACLRVSSAVSRLYGDLMYTFLASPRLDFLIFAKGMFNRERTAIKGGLLS